MALRNWLIHRCTTQRATVTRDEAGAETLTWVNHLQMVRCRLVIKQERLALQNKSFMTASSYTLLIDPDLDVTTKDRVYEVMFEDKLIEAGPFDVMAVMPRRGKAERFLSLALEKVD